jgi:hypothetical protein
MKHLITAVWVFIASSTGLAYADTQAAVVYVQGSVKIVKAGGGETVAMLGSEVSENDTLVTDEGSQVRVRFYDRSLVRLGPSSRAQMSQLRFGSSEAKTVSVKLVIGKLWASVSKLVTPDSRFEVSTSTAVAGVRGTEFAVLMPRSGDCSVTTAEGSVSVRANDGTERMVRAGFEAVLSSNGFRDLRQVSAETITAMRNESRGAAAETRTETRLQTSGAVEAKLDRAMDTLRDRSERGDRDTRSQDAKDRVADRVRIGGEQGTVEQRQRSRDIFEPINTRAAVTRLRGTLDLRE